MRRDPAKRPDSEAVDGRPHQVISIRRVVPYRYARDVEPPEIRARFGSAMFLLGFGLTLPAAFVGTIFAMAVATGQSPPWPTIGEGAFFYLLVLGFFGIWPAIGYVLGFGILDGARWVLLCLTCSGAVPGIFLGGLMGIGARGAPASDFLTMEVALSWLWGLPAIGLVLLRATRTGRPLPPVKAFVRMFGSGWRRSLPGPQTQWAEVRAGTIRYPLRVPGAEFALPPEAAGAIYSAGGRARVTYDLKRGWIESIEVGPADAPSPPP